jgi:PAS domain S-box-containing protein
MSAKGHARARLPFGDEARDRLLAQVAFEAIWERDLDSQSITWDERVGSIFGYDRGEVLNDLSWWRERVHPEDLERAEQTALEAVRSGECRWSNEYRFRRKDGSWAWVYSLGAIERDGEGRAIRAVGAMIDFGPLKLSEARLRLFTDQIPARATATDRELRVVWDVGAGFPGNPTAVGKTVQELFADSPDIERVLDGCRRALAGESCKLQIDDGEQAAQLQLGPARDLAGNVIGVMGVAFDVTERARAESALREAQRVLEQKREQLQALSRKLIEAQEAERRAVARELHDDFGQVLTAIKLNLERRERDPAESIALVDGAIDRMRDLAQDLRPPLLDELGLEASLRWYVDREARRAGLEFDLAFSLAANRPAPAVETTCFRVAQEALTNVIRHARARRVAIELDGGAEGALVLAVRDDGKGFDVAAARKSATSQGLLGMQERVALVGGEFRIESGPDGTTVRARLPLDGCAPP